MSFTAVVAGNPTNATDINQLINALNGTTANAIVLLGTAATATPVTTHQPSAPASDTATVASDVTGDTTVRAALYIATTGFGGILLGSGGVGGISAHIRGISGGARVDENWTVGGGLTVVGSSTFAGIVNSGTFSSDGGAFTSSGAGAVSAASFTASGALTGGSLSVASGKHTVDTAGLVTFAKTLSAGNQLMDWQQGYGLYSDNTGGTFTGGTTRNWWDNPTSGAEIHIGGRAGTALLAGLRFRTNQIRVDGPVSGWVLWDAENTSLGTRFSTNGAIIAHFGQSADTHQLIVNGGFQFGSGGADAAELEWTDDLALGPGDIVCWADDETHGGRLVRCTHEDCAAAGIISTKPSMTMGGETVDVIEDYEDREEIGWDEEGPILAWEPHADDPDVKVLTMATRPVTRQRIATVYSSDPHWKPLALGGKVPAFVDGDVAAYRPGMPLVSAGTGRLRPWRDGDHWPIAYVASTKTDVAHRALPAGAVLALVK